MSDRAVAVVACLAVVLLLAAFSGGVFYERSRQATPPPETSIDEDCKDLVSTSIKANFSCPHPLHALIVGDERNVCRCPGNDR